MRSASNLDPFLRRCLGSQVVVSVVRMIRFIRMIRVIRFIRILGLLGFIGNVKKSDYVFEFQRTVPSIQHLTSNT